MADAAAREIDALTRAIDVHSLRILVAIDQGGSISAAARSLGLSQPTVTQHVQRLEERLGAALVARRARSARLTSVGSLLAQHAPRIDASLTAAATELARALGRRAGLVRIAAPPELIGAIVAPAVGRLAVEVPGTDIVIHEAADNVEAIDLVRNGRSDIGIVPTVLYPRETLQRARPAGMRSTFLFSEEIIALTTSDLPAPGGRVDPAALAGEPWIAGSGTCSDAIAAHVGRVRGTTDVLVSRGDAAIALASHGCGVTFVAESSLAGVPLPAGLRALGLAPAIRRRMIATTLVEAVSIPTVSAALRLLTSHQPSPTGVEAILGARRRSTGHRARFTSVASPSTPSEETTTMTLTSTGTLARVVAVTAAGALALAACTGSDDPGATTSAAGPTVGADTGEEIDSVTVALPGSLSSLYVGTEAGILNYYVAAIAQEGLVSIDADGDIQPGIAESWEQTDDVTYVYQIRDDALFQDATPVTADDVVFSLEMARDETLSPGLAYYLLNVDTIEKTAENEVTVTLVEPDAAFAKNMSAGGAAFITSQAFWEANDGNVGTSESLLLGTGPYKVTEFAPDSHVTFERVDTWWGELPKARAITINFIADESTRLLAAQSGKVDLAFNVPLAQASQWESLDDMRVEYANDLSYLGLYFNVGVAPFDDVDVRRAFAYASNKQAYVDAILNGHGEAATAIMTPESLGSIYSAEDARALLSSQIPQYEYDLEKAREALAASAHPDGFETEILTPNTGPQITTAAQALSQDLAEIGITLTVREVPVEEWLASLDASSEYGVNYMWYFSTLGDPAEVPSYMLGAYNPSGLESAESSALLSQIGAESDPSARVDLLIDLETLQAEQAINIPLWWGQMATAFATDLGMDEVTSFAFISSWPTQLFRAAE